MHTHALPSEHTPAAARIGIARSAMRLLLLILVVALALPLLWQSLRAATTLRIDVGAWDDRAALTGVYGMEQSASEDYRWTTATAQLSLPNLGGAAHILQLHAHGWRPDPQQPAPVVRLDVNGTSLGSIQTTADMRIYRMLLPPDRLSFNRVITMHSDTFEPPGDPRQLGFALDWVELRALDPDGTPALGQFGGQALLMLLLALLVWMLGLPLGWALASLATCWGALVWANWQQPLWVAQALGPWLLISMLLLAATWIGMLWLRRALAPWLSPQQAQVGWALFVAALALRLAGSVHPLFETHDLGVHTGWLEKVIGGQFYLYSTPGELRNREIFNPPGGYVLLAPLLLVLPSLRLVVQVGVALLDATACLLLLPIARELRMPATAGLLALAMATALPISMTMLWWGFATNALAQALWVLLLWLLLHLVRRPTGAATAVFGVVAAMNLLMHAGALVLLVALLGLCGLFSAWRLTSASRRAVLVGLAAAVLLLGPIYFAAAAGPIVQQSNDAPNVATLDLGASLAKGWADRYLRLGYIGQGWLHGFGVPLLALLPFGLTQLMITERRHVLQRPLIGAWIGVCVLFAAAYLGLATVARYIYFATPLVCLAAGAALASYRRWPAGRVVTLAVLLLTAWLGLALWSGGVLLDLKPSLVPLTH